MGPVGRLATRKFAYGLGGGNSGPHWRLRPAIGYGAYAVQSRGRVESSGFFVQVAQNGKLKFVYSDG